MSDCVELQVFRATVSDTEDPDLYVGSTLYNWQSSEEGSWVLTNSLEPLVYTRVLDPHTYGYIYTVTAKLSEQNALYYKLKWK